MACRMIDIEAAAAKLHSLIDGIKTHPPIEATRRAARGSRGHASHARVAHTGRR
jgi:hypothetical protein